jgi:SPP1 gp7 family putative phage head morphogenesis protein
MLAAHVRGISGPEGIDAAIAAWGEQLDEDDRIAGAVYRASFQGFLGGQLMVRDVEATEDDDEPTARAHRREGPFLSLPFEEALRLFRERRLISPEEFDALSDRYREGGFVARRLVSLRLQEVARRSIDALLAQDMTLDEVYAAIREAERPEVRALGIDPASSAYLDTVIRTNVATAYGAGRWAAMTSPDIISARPFVRYVTAGDEAVRPMHRALHGKVFRGGSDEASFYAPPLGYNCRCAMTTLSERQVTSRGYVLTEGRIAGVDPDDGWEGVPRPLASSDL